MPMASVVLWLWISLITRVLCVPVLKSVPMPPMMATGSPQHLGVDSRSITSYGETPTSRTIYTALSLTCMSLLGGMVGYRIRQLKYHQLSTLSLTYFLVFVLYIFSTAFVLFAAIIESGLGLSTNSACRGAVILCLSFYIGSKVTVYLFLIERAHALRAPYIRRCYDWQWVFGIIVIGAGFGTIAGVGLKWPVFGISPQDGRCHIGLRRYVSIPLLSFDVFLNVALTLIFVYLLSPLVRSANLTCSSFPASQLTKFLGTMCRRSRERASVDLRRSNQFMEARMEELLWKTFVGSVLVMVPTVANLAALCILNGEELGWLCLTLCTIDVTWANCVFHWLTVCGMEVEERALAMQHKSQPSLQTSVLPSQQMTSAGPSFNSRDRTAFNTEESARGQPLGQWSIELERMGKEGYHKSSGTSVVTDWVDCFEYPEVTEKPITSDQPLGRAIKSPSPPLP